MFPANQNIKKNPSLSLSSATESDTKLIQCLRIYSLLQHVMKSLDLRTFHCFIYFCCMDNCSDINKKIERMCYTHVYKIIMH